jgi:hypothetical protein
MGVLLRAASAIGGQPPPPAQAARASLLYVARFPHGPLRFTITPRAPLGQACEDELVCAPLPRAFVRKNARCTAKQAAVCEGTCLCETSRRLANVHSVLADARAWFSFYPQGWVTPTDSEKARVQHRSCKNFWSCGDSEGTIARYDEAVKAIRCRCTRRGSRNTDPSADIWLVTMIATTA